VTFSGAKFLLFDSVGNAWPKVVFPQVAFAGRSNAGKSSILNALTGSSRLARVSNTPGRTRGIVIFEVMGRYAFADLPGYGFAKVSRSEREAWKALVEGYLSECKKLLRVYIIVDLRRGPGEDDRLLAEYLAAHSMSYQWVGAKADKLSSRELPKALATFSGEPWLDAGGEVVWTSVRTMAGIDRLRNEIRAVFSSGAKTR